MANWHLGSYAGASEATLVSGELRRRMGSHIGACRVTGIATMALETLSDATLTRPQSTCPPPNDMPLLLVRLQPLDARLTCVDVNLARSDAMLALLVTPTVCQMNPVHTLLPYLHTIYFTIILPPTTRYCKRCLSLQSSDQNFVRISYVTRCRLLMYRSNLRHGRRFKNHFFSHPGGLRMCESSLVSSHPFNLFFLTSSSSSPSITRRTQLCVHGLKESIKGFY